MAGIPDVTVHLIVTSPPYPMIAMWDPVFAGWSPEIADFLANRRGPDAFAAIHDQLERVWRECFRVLVPGGIACINIGDATRTIGAEFALYPNHARIVLGMAAAGFTVLPDILWRKPSNSPT